MASLSPEMLTTIVTVPIAFGGFGVYAGRRLARIERHLDEVAQRLGGGIHRGEGRVQNVDDRLLALATGLKLLIDQAQRSDTGA